MPIQTEKDRSQVEVFCLEELIGPEHPVRVIDAYVEGLDLDGLLND